jgi:hypothetical protein
VDRNHESSLGPFVGQRLWQKKFFLLIIRQNTPNESVLGYWLVLNINFLKKYIKSIVNVWSTCIW